MSVAVRCAHPGDAGTIYRFICALAAYEREPDAVKVTEEVLYDQMKFQQPPFECLIAESNGVAVGFSLFYQNYSTWDGAPGLYLEDLFVEESSRGLGVGYVLFKKLAEIAIERNYLRMEWAVLNWNQPAFDFYDGFNAKKQGDWTTLRLIREDIEQLAAQ